MMREIICYAAQIAIPVWVVLSVLIVIKLIIENVKLDKKIAEMLVALEKSTSICNDLGKTSRELIDMDRNEIAIFESKAAELDELRAKYEFRIQEVSEYLDSFAERLRKCCDAVSANDAKVRTLDENVISCSKAVCLLMNDVRELKKNGLTVWHVHESECDTSEDWSEKDEN